MATGLEQVTTVKTGPQACGEFLAAQTETGFRGTTLPAVGRRTTQKQKTPWRGGGGQRHISLHAHVGSSQIAELLEKKSDALDGHAVSEYFGQNVCFR